MDTNEFCDNNMTTIMLQNVRSLPKNLDALNVYLTTLKCKPKIICLTETWLKDCHPIGLYNINGYHPIITANRVRRGGGVAFYISENLKFQDYRHIQSKFLANFINKNKAIEQLRNHFNLSLSTTKRCQ